MAYLDDLYAQLLEKNKQITALTIKLSQTKLFKGRRPIKKAINELQHDVRKINQAIKVAEKNQTQQLGLEKGIDVKQNSLNAIAGMISAGGESASKVIGSVYGEYGVAGKGKVGIAEQNRLSKQPNSANTSFLTTMDSKTMGILAVVVVVVLALIFKRK